jgi:hypothetical protein
MASGLYSKGREQFLTGAISWTDDTIKAVLIDTAVYTVDLAADEFLSDIDDDAKLSTATLASKTASAG